MLAPGSDTADKVTPSHGFLGYALAVAVTFLVFVVGMGLFAALDSDPYWGFVDTATLMLFAGLIPAAIIGSTGAAIVHLATRRASSQWPAVALAGILGLLVGLLVFPDEWALSALLAFAAAVGRIAVFPLRRRKVTHAEL
jgi:xanthosine utilization system XapX-like protein